VGGWRRAFTGGVAGTREGVAAEDLNRKVGLLTIFLCFLGAGKRAEGEDVSLFYICI